MTAPLGKLLLVLGLLIAGTGVALMLADKIPFLGRLPGDFSVKKDNFHFYFPLATSLIVSIVLSLVLWLISFLRGK